MQYADDYDKLRIIHIDKNQGKAHALNIELGFAKGKYIVTNDADTIPSADALNRYSRYLATNYVNYIGAVTANVDVQNRTKIIAKSQRVEFSSIVGIIKRTQAAVMVAYMHTVEQTLYIAKKHLLMSDYLDKISATEDIRVAWDHQINGWFSVFAPAITFLCKYLIFISKERDGPKEELKFG